MGLMHTLLKKEPSEVLRHYKALESKLSEAEKEIAELHTVLDANQIQECDEIREANVTIKTLALTLKEAADDMDSWGTHVPEYFAEKHGLKEDLNKYRNLAQQYLKEGE